MFSKICSRRLRLSLNDWYIANNFNKNINFVNIYVLHDYVFNLIGNHMHEFLNAFVGAFVTNRTILWKFCDRKPCWVDDEETCSKYLRRSSWIPSYKEVSAKMHERGCGISTDAQQVIHFRIRYNAEKILACCGIHNLTMTFVDYGGMDR